MVQSTDVVHSSIQLSLQKRLQFCSISNFTILSAVNHVLLLSMSLEWTDTPLPPDFDRDSVSVLLMERLTAAEGATSGISRKAAPIERTLPCSLEDLYKGTTKKMKISRDVIDATGRPNTTEEILSIEIKPGWKKGTKITFPEKGHVERGLISADLVFIIDEKPHSVFKRDGNDLVVTQKLSLLESLTGYTAQVTTLDGRTLTIPINSVISPTYEEVIRGEGMPIPKEPGKKGNLRIKFNIKFPSRLTPEQKSGIKRLLTSP